MGVEVTGSGNAPANQTTNAGRSGAPPAADTTAQATAHAKFGEALKQESRNPSQPVDLQYHGDPDRLKSPMSRSDGPDYSKPIPQLPSNSLKLPEFSPYHDGGLNGAHIIGVKGKF